ncbi:hypothetical protein [Streptomyces sp. NPDC004546]|uniref:hypothetical protein n=1 Tax=Streptomyces sp. NPDC004546 TaxID=3154282 RepID=UPI0033AC8655
MPIPAGRPLLRPHLPPTATVTPGAIPPARPPATRADRYERPVLAAIAALAAVLCLGGLEHSTYHAFYASAVRSMTDSPAGFFYGSFGRVGPTSTGPGTASTTLGPQRLRLLAYLMAHRDGARYLAAVPGWQSAAPYVIAADASVLPMGGFTGRVPYPAPAAFRKLVDTGRLHYVLVPRADLRPGALAAVRPVGVLLRWTATHCELVPPAAYDPVDRIRLLYHCGPAHQG